MTLVLTVFLGIKVFFLVYSLKNKIKKQGQKRASMQSKFYKILNETFGNFKIIKLIQANTKNTITPQIRNNLFNTIVHTIE